MQHLWTRRFLPPPPTINATKNDLRPPGEVLLALAVEKSVEPEAVTPTALLSKRIRTAAIRGQGKMIVLLLGALFLG